MDKKSENKSLAFIGVLFLLFIIVVGAMVYEEAPTNVITNTITMEIK